jgi:uncharacterized membrane protein YhiD involved in acid resistance
VFSQSYLTDYSKIGNPTLEMVLFSFVLSFLLSSLIAFAYDKTTQMTLKKTNFIQSLILSSMIATMVLQAIGDNVASGLGMLGALSVVQFRNKLANPRDTIFIFAALGMGISCGLYGFHIAAIGTVIFCILAFVLRFTPYHFGHQVVWRLTLKSNQPINHSTDFERVMNQFCHLWTMRNVEFTKLPATAIAPETQVQMYVYSVILKDENTQTFFFRALENLNIWSIRMDKKDEK